MRSYFPARTHCVFCENAFGDSPRNKAVPRDVVLAHPFDEVYSRVRGALAFRDTGTLCNYCFVRITQGYHAAERLPYINPEP